MRNLINKASMKKALLAGLFAFAIFTGSLGAAGLVSAADNQPAAGISTKSIIVVPCEGKVKTSCGGRIGVCTKKIWGFTIKYLCIKWSCWTYVQPC